MVSAGLSDAKCFRPRSATLVSNQSDLNLIILKPKAPEMDVAQDLVLWSHQVTPFGTDWNFVLLWEQACLSCSTLSSTHFWWWFGSVVINRILHNFILTIVWNELKAQQGKILSFVSRMLMKTSLTMLKAMSSLLKMTGKQSELSVMMTWPLGVYVVSNSDL